jgi:hypothetical protein
MYVMITFTFVILSIIYYYQTRTLLFFLGHYRRRSAARLFDSLTVLLLEHAGVELLDEMHKADSSVFPFESTTLCLVGS